LRRFNHPNICQIYDVGPNYLVMELIDGVPLRGPLPVEKAIAYAGLILDALDAAHRKGFTHRDLKPANILVTRQGLKLLDFGLAKRNPGGLGEDEKTASALTIEGQISGTLQYMAPEQLQGKESDARSDIFAFGCVLYEMITGQRAFKGSGAASIIAAIMEHPIPSLGTVAPPELDAVLKRCLEKDPDERWQNARDLKWELMRAASPTRPPAGVRTGSNANRAAWAVAATALVAAAGVSLVHFRERPAETPLVISSIGPPANPPDDESFRNAEISPDGKRIVISVRRSGNNTQLWLRSLDNSTAQPLAGTEGGYYPFWSPDSRSIAFFAQGKLRRMDLPAGAPVTLADAPRGVGGSWNASGVILFGEFSAGLQQIPAAGGTAVALTFGQGVRHPGDPWFLPDGRHFLFADYRDYAGNDAMLRLGSLDSHEPTALGPVNSQAAYANGRILFIRGNALIAQAFDDRRNEAGAENATLARDVTAFSISRGGALIYQAGSPLSAQRLNWYTRDGKATGTFGEPANLFTIEFSPDRKTVAVAADETLWLYDASRGARSRLTFAKGINTSPVWSPDGRDIAFCSDRSGRYAVYRKTVSLDGAEETLYGDTIDTLTDSWSPDGQFLMVHRRDPKNQEDLAVIPATRGSGAATAPRPFSQTPFRELHGKFSPDGKWVAYVSDESGRTEIYISPFPGPGPRQQITTDGAAQPRWRVDGKELYYASGGFVHAVEVIARGGAIEPGATHSLGIPVTMGRGWLYDVSADGQRFLSAIPPGQNNGQGPLTLITNWPMLLRK
jgi:eukaryotic-like serine/threonine-protein kinase